MKKLSLGTGSRKAAMFVVAIGLGTGMCYSGKLTGAEWLSLVQFLFGFLAAGLTAEHFSRQNK